MKDQSEDRRLRDAVIEEFRWDALVDESQLGVDVQDRVVTLVGTVGSIAQKLAAQSAAEAVAGVHDVLSRVDVKVPVTSQQTDAEIERVVKQVLAWHALVPEQDVTLRVSDAWVTLGGTVSTRSQSEQAEQAVSHLVGIRGVTNNIMLGEPQLTPEAVRDAINEALGRRATHRARRIDVIVDDGAVILRGPVESLGQKRAIHEAIGHAPGVDVLSDELHVE